MLIGPFQFNVRLRSLLLKWREAFEERPAGRGRGYSAEELCVVRASQRLVIDEAQLSGPRQREALRLSYAAAKHYLARLETDRPEVLAAAALIAAALSAMASGRYNSKRYDEIEPGLWARWLGRSNRYWLMGARFALRAYRSDPSDDLASFLLSFLSCGTLDAGRMRAFRIRGRRRTFFLRRYAEHLVDAVAKAPNSLDEANIEAAFVPGDLRWSALLDGEANCALLRLLESGADWRKIRAPDGAALDAGGMAEGAARLRLLILGERWDSIWIYTWVPVDRKDVYSRVIEGVVKEESDDIEKRFASAAGRPEAAVIKRKLLDAISRRR